MEKRDKITKEDQGKITRGDGGKDKGRELIPIDEEEEGMMMTEPEFLLETIIEEEDDGEETTMADQAVITREDEGDRVQVCMLTDVDDDANVMMKGDDDVLKKMTERYEKGRDRIMKEAQDNTVKVDEGKEGKSEGS